MEFKIELNGIVFQKSEPKTNNSYTNQELILYIPDVEKDSYSNYFTIEWNEKGIKTLQELEIQEGDQVKVTAYLQGRKWKKEGMDEYKAFTSWKGVSIQKSEEETSELPF